MRKLNKNNGITLIALVITIIVMLILVSVSISMAVNGGLFEYAGKAVGDTQNAIDAEKELSKGRIKIGGVWYDSLQDVADNKPSENQGDVTPISTEESYIGYYADINGDGIVDGVIYADLAISKSGNWADDSYSNYEYTAQNNLKEYVVSENSYEEVFGTQPIIKVKANSKEGTDRFYVMALEDIKTTIDGTEYTGFYWYKNASGKLDRTVTAKYNDFGKGKRNTSAWLNNWNTNTATYGEQNARDLWGVIQNSENSKGKKYNIVENESDSGKWFVPSKAEWGAFGDYLYTKLGITENNYRDYNLSDYYWTSSVNSRYGAYSPHFGAGSASWLFVDVVTGCSNSVRLSATF